MVDNVTRTNFYHQLSLNNLRQLKLSCDLYNGLEWPVQHRLESLTLNHMYSCFMLNQSPGLKRLVLHCPSMFKTDGTTFADCLMNKFNHLTSFSLLYPSGDLTRNDMELILTLFPNLTHLRLFMWTSDYNDSLFNGNQWENFIQTNLPQLNQFDFCFHHIEHHFGLKINVALLNMILPMNITIQIMRMILINIICAVYTQYQSFGKTLVILIGRFKSVTQDTTITFLMRKC